MKLSFFFAGIAFAASNNVQSCMKHVTSNNAPVMERAMGAVACLERNGAEIKLGECIGTFVKVMVFLIFGSSQDMGPWSSNNLKNTNFRRWRNVKISKSMTQFVMNLIHHSTQPNAGPRSTPVSWLALDNCCPAQCLEQPFSINFISIFIFHFFESITYGVSLRSC